MPVTINYQDSNVSLSTWDADITYLHLPEDIKAEIREEARKEAHESMEEMEPEFYESLVTDRKFSFDANELIERHPPKNPNANHDPQDGLLEARIENSEELDEFIRELSQDYWIDEYLSSIRRRVDQLRRTTSFSHREFVAFVLAENPDITWKRAAELMGIAEGTFSGKMGDNVRPKIETAQNTAEFVDKVRSE